MIQVREIPSNPSVVATETFRGSDLSPASIAAWKASRDIRSKHLFILLLGPSAVGKSSLVKSLKLMYPNRYHYIRPFTTRPARPNETEKTPVTDKVFDHMKAKGVFVCVTDLYGFRYGTPLTPILEAQKSGQLPILDFPLERTSELRHPDYDLVKFYILPSTVDEWKQRLVASGRNSGGRYETGLAELSRLHEHSFSHPDVDFYIVNPVDQLNNTAATFHRVTSQLRSGQT